MHLINLKNIFCNNTLNPWFPAGGIAGGAARAGGAPREGGTLDGGAPRGEGCVGSLESNLAGGASRGGGLAGEGPREFGLGGGAAREVLLD